MHNIVAFLAMWWEGRFRQMKPVNYYREAGLGQQSPDLDEVSQLQGQNVC